MKIARNLMNYMQFADSIKGKNDCELKCEKRRRKCDISGKEWRKRNRRKRSNRKNSSRSGDKNSNKIDGKRHYSQQSIFSIPQDRKFFSNLIPDIVLGTNVSKTVQRFYASCSKVEKDRKQDICNKRKRKCEAKEKDKIKEKCVKGPARCISRKKISNKKSQICQSIQKDEFKESCESTKKSKREEYCLGRKKELMKGKLYLIYLIIINVKRCLLIFSLHHGLCRNSLILLL